MFLKFLTIAIALVNVMARQLVFRASHHSLSYRDFGTLLVVPGRLLSLHWINFVEPEVHKPRVLVTKFTKLSWHSSQVVGAEEDVWVWTQTKPEILSHFVHAPTLIHLAECIVIES